MTTTAARTAHQLGEHCPTDTTTNDDRARWHRECAFCARLYTIDGEFKLDARTTARRAPSHTETDAPIAGRARYTNPERVARPINPATQAQLDFIKALVLKHDCPPALLAANRASAVAGTFSKANASEFIGQLKACPLKAAQPTAEPTAPAQPTADPRKPWPKVAEGYYALSIDALQGTEFKNDINFFFISRPTEGRFAGRTFVKLMASDDRHPVRGELARLVLESIAADPHAAQMLFADKSEHCYLCNRRLTDDESRARGMGSTCASK